MLHQTDLFPFPFVLLLRFLSGRPVLTTSDSASSSFATALP